MQIITCDNNVDQALRALKKKLQREGVYREMKLRRHYENRRKSAPASGPQRSAARASSSASAPSAKAPRAAAAACRSLSRSPPPPAAAARASCGSRCSRWIAAGVALAWGGTSPLRGETTAGLRIRTIEQGTGAFIQPVDGVMVEYEGRLTDGTVFDASERHGGPQPMVAGNVIPGFAEALTKMKQGGRYRIHIPGKLAYGASLPPGSPFGPNADLEFDVHIVQIVRNAALMTGGASCSRRCSGGSGLAPPPKRLARAPSGSRTCLTAAAAAAALAGSEPPRAPVPPVPPRRG